MTNNKPLDPNDIEFNLGPSQLEIDEDDMHKSVTTEKVKHKRIFSKGVLNRTGSKVRDEGELVNRSSIIIKKHVIERKAAKNIDTRSLQLNEGSGIGSDSDSDDKSSMLGESSKKKPSKKKGKKKRKSSGRRRT